MRARLLGQGSFKLFLFEVKEDLEVQGKSSSLLTDKRVDTLITSIRFGHNVNDVDANLRMKSVALTIVCRL